MKKPKNKHHHDYTILQPTRLRCAPGKLRGLMRSRGAELATDHTTGAVIEHFYLDTVEEASERGDGDLWI